MAEGFATGPRPVAPSPDTVTQDLEFERALAALETDDSAIEDALASLEDADSFDAESDYARGLPLLNNGLPMFPLGSAGVAGADNPVSRGIIEYWQEDNRTPEEWAPVMDALGGFNNSFANVLQVPVDVADQALQAMGVELLDQYSSGGEIDEGVVFDLMQQAGINTQTADTAANLIGREVFTGAVTASAMFAAAPYFAARSGTTIAGALKPIGRFIMEHPYISAITEFGSAIGAGMGGHYADDVPYGGQEVATLGGAIVGGASASGLAHSISAGGRLATRAAGRVGDVLDDLWLDATGRGKTPPPRTAPIRDPNAIPGDVSIWSQEAIAGDRMRLEEEIAELVRRPDNLAPSGEISERLYNRLGRVRDKYREQDVKNWEKLPRNLTVDATEALEASEALLTRYADVAPEYLPSDQISKIQGLFKRQAAQWARETDTDITEMSIKEMLDAGAPFKLTLGQTQDLRSAVLYQKRKLNLGKDVLASNFDKLQDSLINSMQTALQARSGGQSFKDFETARAFTQYRHDLFTRGPVGELFATNPLGGERVQPEQALSRLMARFGGLEKLQQIDAGGDQRYKPLAREFSDGVVSMFYEAAEAQRAMKLGQGDQVQLQAAAEGASKFARSPQVQKIAEKIGEVGVAITKEAELLQNLVLKRKELDRSALAMWANTSPDKAASRVFSSDRPAQAVREIMAQAKRDPNEVAEGAFRRALIDKFLHLSGLKEDTYGRLFGLGKQGAEGTLSPGMAAKTFANPQVQEALREALGPDQYKRLAMIIEDGARVEAGDTRAGGRLFRATSIFAARIFGAQAGRTLSQITGGGTVQTPAITSRALQVTVQRALGSLDAGELMARAISDPKWAEMLAKEVPRSTTEAQELAKTIRRLISISEGTRQMSRGIREDRAEQRERQRLTDEAMQALE